MNLKNLFTRTIAGVIYIAIVLCGIFGGQYAFLVVFGMLLAISLFEFFRMVGKNEQVRISKTLNIVSGLAIFVAALLFPQSALLLTALYLLFQLASTLFINKHNGLLSAAYSLFGQFYITLPFILLSLIYAANETINQKLILAIFIFIWISDTAAFLVGSLFGKHKLFERISPKKTIEGFIGGVILATSAGFLFAELIPEFSLLFWIGFGLITSMIGTLGDLFESLVKRTYEVKDSGALIPGHGGMLDRIDSFLFAVVAVYCYMQLTLWF